MRGGVVRLVARLGLVAAFSSCIATPTLVAPDRPALHVSNGTTMDVTLFVNGVPVGVFPSGGPPPEIDTTGLNPVPWVVEARSASGRVLTSMNVEPGQVWTTTRPDGGMSTRSTMGRVDLSCGRLTIWAGDGTPSGPPPAENPGQPGDCVP